MNDNINMTQISELLCGDRDNNLSIEHRRAQRPSRNYGLPRGGRKYRRHGKPTKAPAETTATSQVDESQPISAAKPTVAQPVQLPRTSGSPDKLGTFDPLGVSSKYAICGMPFNADTYRGGGCFGCAYCEANCRKFMPASQSLQVANCHAAERTFRRVLIDKQVAPTKFLDVCISQNLTIHAGAMGDPLQPAEAYLHATREFLALCSDYDRHVVLSTKSASLYGADIDPSHVSIQMSVSNIMNRRDIEPNVADIRQRIRFFNALKDAGVRVGIRIQPFLPGVSGVNILELFKDADHYVIEGLKLVPQNAEHIQQMLKTLGLPREDFKAIGGHLCIRPELRLELYKPLIAYCESNNLSYSVADNDLRVLGNNICCCGDALVNKSTSFNTTALIAKYGVNYTKEQMLAEVRNSSFAQCKASHLAASNRQQFGTTVEEILTTKFDVRQSPSSPRFFYRA